MDVAEVKNYRRNWIYDEKVEIKDVMAIAGWGVGKAVLKNAFNFAFCEVENWHNRGDIYTLDAFMDVAAEVPVYYFKCYDDAIQFAKTKSNRYPLERRIWWLRFQPDYWFATIYTYYMDTLRYLSSAERFEYLQQLNSEHDDRVLW